MNIVQIEISTAERVLYVFMIWGILYIKLQTSPNIPKALIITKSGCSNGIDDM